MLRAGIAAFALCLAVPGAGHAAEDESVTLGSVTAQLYYKNSGRLSDDLLAGAEPFVGWNTIIGGGTAEEPADDLLVVVRLENAGEEAFLSENLRLWVTDVEGGIVAERNFDGLLVPQEGTLANPLWIEDATCGGALVIHARFRGKETSGTLHLHCGE